MATTEQLTTMLAEAEAAYHQIMMGGGVKVFVDQNGERVEYNQASSGRLAMYIQNLKAQLGQVTPGPMMTVM